MGSYSTTGKVERYQDLMRIVHSNNSVSPLLVLRQSAPYIGFLSQSTISYLAKTLLVLYEQERLSILSSHADMPLCYGHTSCTVIMDAQLTELATLCIEVEKVSCCSQYAHDHNARMPTPTRLSIRRLRNSEASEPALRFPGTTSKTNSLTVRCLRRLVEP